MKFNKKVLAAAVAGALGSVSGSAWAVLDMDAGTVSPVTYASEYDLQSAESFTVDAVQKEVDFNYAGDTYYVFFGLSSNAAFESGALPTLSGCSGGAGADCSVSGSNVVDFDGGTGNAMIFSLDAGSNGVSSDLPLTLNLGTAAGVVLNSAQDVNITYRLYAGVNDANNANDNFLRETTTPFVAFDSVVGKGTGNSANFAPKIDVTQQSKLFEADAAKGVTTDTAALCEVSLAFDGTPLLRNGSSTVAAGVTQVLSPNTGAAGSLLTFSGDFSAAQDSSTGAFSTQTAENRVFLDTNSDCSSTLGSGAVASDELSQDQAVFYTTNQTFADVVDGTVNGTTGGVYLCLNVNGETAIPVSTYSAVYSPESGADADNIPFSVPSIDYTCGETTKGGSTVEIPMVLDPASPYRYFLRVSNPSSVSGNVIITAFNDDGVAGGSSWTFNLPAGHSTGLITAQNIIDNTGVSLTASASVPGVARNKIRLVIDAEFTGVLARSYAQSKVDNNRAGFSEFQ